MTRTPFLRRVAGIYASLRAYGYSRRNSLRQALKITLRDGSHC